MNEIIVRHFCVKTVYQDEQTARRHAVHARKDGKPRLSRKQPYQCAICSVPGVPAWHLRVVNERKESS